MCAFLAAAAAAAVAVARRAESVCWRLPVHFFLSLSLQSAYQLFSGIATIFNKSLLNSH
jgi:hypothetical protein